MTLNEIDIILRNFAIDVLHCANADPDKVIDESVIVSYRNEIFEKVKNES